jgi:hypothetical protein
MIVALSEQDATRLTHEMSTRVNCAVGFGMPMSTQHDHTEDKMHTAARSHSHSPNTPRVDRLWLGYQSRWADIANPKAVQSANRAERLVGTHIELPRHAHFAPNMPVLLAQADGYPLGVDFQTHPQG